MSKQLKKQEKGELVESSGFFTPTGNTGFENLDTVNELQIPFLRIAQTNTAQADENDAAYIKGLKPGLFYNNLSGKNYGKEVNIVLLNRFLNYMIKEPGTTEIIEILTEKQFEERKSEFIIDGFNITTKDDKEVMEMRNFFCLNVDALEDGIMIFTLKKTGIPHYRKIMTLANMKKHPQASESVMWHSVYSMSTTQIQNNAGQKWYGIGDKKALLFRHEGWVPEEIQQVVLSASEMVATYKDRTGDIKYTEDVAQDTEL